MIGKGRRPAPWTEAELEEVLAARARGETLRIIAARHMVSQQHIRVLLARCGRLRRLGLPLAPPFREVKPRSMWFACALAEERAQPHPNAEHIKSLLLHLRIARERGD